MSARSPTRHVGADRTLIVSRTHDPTIQVSAVEQLMAHARTTVPAVLNYLFFGASNVAVVYFGKKVDGNGVKYGIEGGEDMKIRMLRFLMAEIWPQLLRTDVPDESLTELESPHSVRTQSATATVASLQSPTVHVPDSPVTGESTAFPAEAAKRQRWLQLSLESGMQVLVFLKPGANKTKYLKLILSNPLRRLHFDIVDSREEKYRWDNRMLFIRMLDNLETQKAIDSYETYERFFREACEYSGKHCVELERPDQPLVTVVYHDTGPLSGCCGSTATLASVRAQLSVQQQLASLGASPAAQDPPVFLLSPAAGQASMDSEPSSRSRTPQHGRLSSSVGSSPSLHACSAAPKTQSRRYRWFDNLEKPESLTLDYKSYFMNPAMEIQYRAVKFMCGFLNGIGRGRLVIGVHEMERQTVSNSSMASSATGSKSSPTATGMDGTASPSSIVTHNMMVEQLVVGVSITNLEISNLQYELSEQLQQCIPPIPPQAVQIDIVPIEFPERTLRPGHLVLLYDTAATGWRDSFRQKSNHAIRQLRRKGYSLCPFSFESLDDLQQVFPAASSVLPNHVTGWQVFAVVPIGNADGCPGTDAIGEDQPLNFVDEITAMLNNHTKGKGLHRVLRLDEVELPELRIVEVSVDRARLRGVLPTPYTGKYFYNWPSIPIWNPMTQSVTRVDRNYLIFSSSASSDDGTRVDSVGSHVAPSRWYEMNAVVATVFTMTCGEQYPRSAKSRKLRLVNRSFNKAFEHKLGLPLVEMLRSTPVGTPGFVITRETTALLQTALKVSRLPRLPLLLVHIYELLGTLHSPYPFVAVPAVAQSMRVNPHLIPIYWSQSDEDLSLKPSIVLDSYDGVVKALRWIGASVACEPVMGVGFQRISRRKVELHAAQNSKQPKSRLMRTKSLRNIRAGLKEEDDEEQAVATSSYHADPNAVAVSTSESTSSTMGTPACSFMTSTSLAGGFRPATIAHSVRKMEPNIPLLQFTFFRADDESTKVFHHTHPWTIASLLKWLRTATHDPRVRSFGNCDRSFALYPDLTKEVCAAHYRLEDDEPFGDGDSSEQSLPSAASPATSYYASSFDCIVCKLTIDWNGPKR